MTHLYIELNTGLTEEVDIKVIEKLYDTVTNNTLDETSDLKGRLHTPSARDIHVSYLTTRFPELYITADIQYITFADPDVLSLLTNYIGDGVGLILAHILSFILSGKAFGVRYYNTYRGDEVNWTYYYQQSTSVDTFNEFGTLFNGLTKIHYNAFKDFTNLTSIVIPSTVTEIGSSAFLNTLALTSLNLENILSIRESAFANSNIGGDISLPNLTYIGGTAFLGTKITSISFQALTKLNGNDIFNGCNNLTTVTGLSNLTSIPGRTFYNCNALSSVDIDWNKITSVETLAFMRCNSLLFGELDLSTVTTIPQEAFRECNGITKLLLGNNTTISGTSAFDRCTGITEANLGSGITFNANTTFYGCTNLTTVTGLSGITTIPSWTFNGCTSLSSVDIDWSKITSIGTCALSNCPIGTGLTIELNLTNQSLHFGGAFEKTKFDKLIVHCNWSGSGDNNHPPFINLPYTTYIDVSDCILHTVNGYSLSSVIGDNSLVTIIYPPSVNQIRCGQWGFRNALGTFRYMIILNTTPPDINVDSNNPLSSQFPSNSILHIYVPDSAVSDYLADSKWSQLRGDNGTVTILLRLHGLSELPAGVWTTGLASQYLTPAQLATT